MSIETASGGRNRNGGLTRNSDSQIDHFQFFKVQTNKGVWKSLESILHSRTKRYSEWTALSRIVLRAARSAPTQFIAELKRSAKISMTTNQPQRHGCLTAFLLFMIVVNLLVSGSYLVFSNRIRLPNAPYWMPYLLGFGCALNVVFAIALFRWKKWAFYAVCIAAVISLFSNLWIGIPLFNSALGLAGPALLYGVLQIGKENKGWSQLKWEDPARHYCA